MLENKNEKSITESTTKDLSPKKNDIYYIASGFFNDQQINTVDKIEESLTSLNLKHFSPRQESVPFFKEKDNEIKSMMTNLIFNNNMDSIDSCNKFVVNLQDEDIGTLFEFGYIASRYYGNDYKRGISRNIKVMNDNKGLLLKIMSCPNEDLINYLLPQGHDYKWISDKLKDLKLVNDLRTNKQLAVLCLDDRNPVNMFLMGYYYGRQIPIMTYTHHEYGTNVMMVHSTNHTEDLNKFNKKLTNLNKELNDISYNELDYSKFKLSEAKNYQLINSLLINEQDWNKQID
jgi:nucleoside 2-deoxyribosyltransferase